MRHLSWFLLLTALVLNASANVLIKYSAMRSAPLAGELSGQLSTAQRLQGLLHPAFIIGLTLFALNVFAYQAALRSLKLSMAYPIMVSGGYLIILVASWLLFHERLQAIQYAGVALIVAGIWLVVR